MIQFELFLYMVCGRGPDCYFCKWISNFQAASFEKTIFFLMNCLRTLIKNELTINIWVYFCTINSVLLVYILMPLLYCLDFYSFAIIFEIKKCEFSIFVFSPKVVLAIWDFLNFHMIFGSLYQFLQRNQLRFL